MSEESYAPCGWRPMAAADLAAVGILAARIHPDYPERPEVLAEKFRLFPRGCFVLEGGPEIYGYCFSHPWRAGPPPALDTLLGALPEAPDAYFIHDMALDLAARGRNFAALLAPILLDIARSIPVKRILLVAVGGSEAFWMRMGFHAADNETAQAAARAKYGDGAVQMQLDLTAPVARCAGPAQQE